MVLNVVMVLLLAALGCVAASRGRATATTPAPPPLAKPVDLTMSLAAHATMDQLFLVTKNTSAKGEFGWKSSQSLCMSGQAGTHIQAPFHLNDAGLKVDTLPLNKLLVAGVLLNVSVEAAHDPNFTITAKHIRDWEKKHGLLTSDSILLIHFGWRSLGQTRNMTSGYPGISMEAAKLLVSQDHVVGVGVDVPSLDPLPPADPSRRAEPAAKSSTAPRPEPAARTLMQANKYALLNLNFTNKELPAKGFSLLVLPTKVRSAAVAPVRVVATTRSPLSPPPPRSKSSASEGAASRVLSLAVYSVLVLVACL